MTTMNQLALLQETRETPLWTQWDVTYRDVRILDSSNRVVAIYNLTSHDLGLPANFSALKAFFIGAANGGDTDGDGLPDHWEATYFPRTLAARDEDTDGDGFSNFVELAFGSDPRENVVFPRFRTSLNTKRQLMMNFTRWAGTQLDYIVEGSTNLNSWTASGVVSTLPRTNLYDGTGRTLATYRINSTNAPAAYLRVKLRKP
jgi:hypothetical protein